MIKAATVAVALSFIMAPPRDKKISDLPPQDIASIITINNEIIPLKCNVFIRRTTQILERNVVCDVYIDAAKLESIQINRGNCEHYFNIDPKKIYVFGERIEIPTYCSTILEIKIGVNGKVWTWEK